MRITVLGCATSTGVPIVGCNCAVCKSHEPKNKRTRSSILINLANKNVLIDSSTDLRSQALSTGLTKIDAVLYTHTHADHTHGIDDLRTFNFINKMSIPCFGSSQTIENLQDNFKYIFDESYSAGGKPKLELNTVDGEFSIDDIRVIPIDIEHAQWIITGYRIGNMAYLTDCSGIPEHSKESLKDLDILIIGALRYKPHPAHLSVDEALEIIEELKPKRAFFTHMGHELDYVELSGRLPAGVEPAYDGMQIDI